MKGFAGLCLNHRMGMMPRRKTRASRGGFIRANRTAGVKNDVLQPSRKEP
jgi:hypothetical protein